MFLRHMNLEPLLSRAGFYADLAVVLEHVREVLALHVVPDLTPAIVAEDAADGAGPLVVAEALQTKCVQVVWILRFRAVR
jgi:hypothetical protein